MTTPASPDRATRLAAAVSVAGGRCVWCGRAFGRLVPATTDHLVPRVKGGPSWPENEVASCRRCNGARGHRNPADWLVECAARGWSPDHGLLTAHLGALRSAIAARGGQRRARPYVDAQLRRLERLRTDETPGVSGPATGDPGLSGRAR